MTIRKQQSKSAYEILEQWLSLQSAPCKAEHPPQHPHAGPGMVAAASALPGPGRQRQARATESSVELSSKFWVSARNPVSKNKVGWLLEDT